MTHLPYVPQRNKDALTKHQKIYFWGGVTLSLSIFAYLFQGIFSPFLAAFLIAYILNPGVRQLEKWHVPRIAGSLLMIIAVFACLMIVGLIAFPFLQRELNTLIAHLPDLLENLLKALTPALQRISTYMALGEAPRLEEFAQASLRDLLQWGSRIVLTVLTTSWSVFSGLSFIIVSPVVAFYLLKDWGRILKKISLLPPLSLQPFIHTLAYEIHTTLVGYIRGQSIVCLVLTIYYTLGLSPVIGMKLGIGLGLMVGLLTFIPYIGFFFGLVITLMISFAQSTTGECLSTVTIIFAFGYALEGGVLAPKFVGERIGLNPVWVIFALFAWGNVLGFIGIVLALPLSAALGVLIRRGMRTYRHSMFYTPIS